MRVTAKPGVGWFAVLALAALASLSVSIVVDAGLSTWRGAPSQRAVGVSPGLAPGGLQRPGPAVVTVPSHPAAPRTHPSTPVAPVRPSTSVGVTAPLPKHPAPVVRPVHHHATKPPRPAPPTTERPPVLPPAVPQVLRPVVAPPVTVPPIAVPPVSVIGQPGHPAIAPPTDAQKLARKLAQAARKLAAQQAKLARRLAKAEAKAAAKLVVVQANPAPKPAEERAKTAAAQAKIVAAPANAAAVAAVGAAVPPDRPALPGGPADAAHRHGRPCGPGGG